jgi:hypothetical protein
MFPGESFCLNYDIVQKKHFIDFYKIVNNLNYQYILMVLKITLRITDVFWCASNSPES